MKEVIGAETGQSTQSSYLTDPREMADRIVKQDKAFQNKVNNYNKEIYTAHEDDFFKYRTLGDDLLIVKLEQIDHLVPVSKGSDVYMRNIQRLRTVVAENGESQVKQLIINDFAYHKRGFVVAISDNLKKRYNIEEGDFVELRDFQIEKEAFYKDKSKFIPINENNIRAPHYDGFVSVPGWTIESIVKRKDFKKAYGSDWEDFTIRVDYDAKMNEEELQESIKKDMRSKVKTGKKTSM